MKKCLLATTALVGAGALGGGIALAAEAPEWKLGGNMNFQLYWADPENSGTKVGAGTTKQFDAGATKVWVDRIQVWDTGDTGFQEHGWYFGVDEAELALNVSGAADNGLKYGFKIEIQVNTNDKTVADEARIQLSGGWGTVQLGDEDGAEDIMNYGGENLMGGTGGFDGDQGDVLLRAGEFMDVGDSSGKIRWETDDNEAWNSTSEPQIDGANLSAPSSPSIAGDSSDATKASYFSPRFSGFQVGASITPTPNGGDDFKEDGAWENHYGLGANYDNSFGNLRIRASAVYSANTSNDIGIEDVSAWSVGGIVGFGPFQIGGNYTSNGESGQRKTEIGTTGAYQSSVFDVYHWNVAAGFEAGPLYLSAGYFASVLSTGIPLMSDSTYEHIALTVDYTMAPGLGVYAGIDLITDEIGDVNGILLNANGANDLSQDTTLFILGVKASF